MTLPGVDWARPWLAPYRERGEPAYDAVAAGATVAQALNDLLARDEPVRLAAGALRFVAQGELPGDEPYESHIHRTARVPTRDNLHDFFNGLVWLHQPRLKRRLNEIQAGEIAAAGVRATRGAVRDAATLFDENAALLRAPAALVQALRERDWQGLFVTQRAAWRQAELTLFGHALMEKLVQPRKALTAHVLVLPEGAAPGLTAALLASKPFLPLPVLGVPGWWPANEPPAFYDDPAVFRAAPGCSGGVSTTEGR